MKSPADWRQYSIGHQSGEIRVEGEHLVTDIVVTDPVAIAEIEAGKLSDISAGYERRLDGSLDIEQNAFQQRDIRYNHIGLLPPGKGRAGRSVSIRLDEDGNEISEEPQMKVKIRLDGKDVDTDCGSAEHVQSLQGQIAALTVDLSHSKAASEAVQGRFDQLESELKATKAELATAPAKALEAVKARVTLESDARKVLGVEAKLDSKSDREVKLETIKKLDPSFDPSGKSDDYVSARFDFALQSKPIVGSEAARSVTRLDAGVTDLASKKAEYIRKLDAAAAKLAHPERS